jgi:hypothetical protein
MFCNILSRTARRIAPSYTHKVFLKLDFAEPSRSAKWWQEFHETKMSNGGRVLLAVLNLCVQIKIRLATFDATHSVTDSQQRIIRCFNAEAS